MTLDPDRKHPPVEVEALATGGVFAGIPIDEAALDQLVANWRALRHVHKVPVKIAHDAKQPDGYTERDLTQRLAFGWVDDVKRKGDKLIATVVGMPAPLRDLVNQRALRHCSAEV